MRSLIVTNSTLNLLLDAMTSKDAAEQMANTVGVIKDDLDDMMSNIKGMKGDVGQMKDNLDEIMDDLDDIKDDIYEMKDGMGDIKDELGEIVVDVVEIKCSYSATPSPL